MKVFSLKFKDPNVEAEYREVRMPLTKNFLKHLIGVMAFFMIYSIIMAIVNKKPYVPNFNVVMLIGTLFLLKYHDRFKNIMEMLVVLISIILYGIGLKAIRIFFQDSFNPIVFFIGYNSALFQRLIETRLVRSSSAMMLYIGFFILRIAIITEFTLSALMVQLLLEVLLLISNIERERNIRKLFQSFYDYKQNLFKFKDLMTNYLPENIIIFSKDLTKTLFINETFQKSFACPDMESAKSFINNLNIDQETVHGIDIPSQVKTVESLLAKFSQSPDLLDNRKIVTLNVRSENKEVYQAKILKLIWDQEEAIAVIFSDLTQQETIMSLRLADANKDKVIATVSHELRTPINAIIGFTKILESMIKSPDQQFYLSACRYSADWLLTLVNSILDLSQIRGNCIKLSPVSFDLKQNLEEIRRMFAFQCSQKNLQLQFQISQDLPKTIYTDKNRLNQILINLLNNALKFTYNGCIQLQVQNDPKDQSMLVFQVTDTGIGIKDEDKSKLFKMYGRVDQQDSSINTQGVGLGLTISNELVRLLNPNKQVSGIKFESEFAKGTTFSFTIGKNLQISQKNIPTEETPRKLPDSNATPLPPIKDYKFMPNSLTSTFIGDLQRASVPSRDFTSLLAAEKTFKRHSSNKEDPSQSEFLLNPPLNFYQDTSSDSSSISSSLSETTIKSSWTLLVDDMPFNLIVASHILEKKGLNVKTALNGQEAIKTVQEHYNKGEQFKFILMDCQMPVMDGFEASEILTGMMRSKSLPQIPIIAFSANNSKKDVDRAMKSGMADFLFKPLEEEQFAKIMTSQKIKF